MQRTKKSETTAKEPLSAQMKRRAATAPEKKAEYDGNTETMISSGSTLLDLAISGGRVYGGGFAGGILVEIFGPSGSGKTVFLSEIAGNTQQQGGEVKFYDPEARLNQQFAKMFGLDLNQKDYSRPDTVPEIFEPLRTWKPKSLNVINGVFADSLAALSTDMEMGKEDGDKMGMRRAREFSEEMRKTCRILAKNNYLMVCSNQIRENIDAAAWGQKYKTPGGEAMGFYSSVRLRTMNVVKIKKTLKEDDNDDDNEEENDKKTKKKKGQERIIGVKVDVEVFKNSIWKPYGVAPVTILFDYGIDDIRENLQFIKEKTKANLYRVGDIDLSTSLEKAIRIVEENDYERKLRRNTIQLWQEWEAKFSSNRKARH